MVPESETTSTALSPSMSALSGTVSASLSSCVTTLTFAVEPRRRPSRLPSTRTSMGNSAFAEPEPAGAAAAAPEEAASSGAAGEAATGEMKDTVPVYSLCGWLVKVTWSPTWMSAMSASLTVALTSSMESSATLSSGPSAGRPCWAVTVVTTPLSGERSWAPEMSNSSFALASSAATRVPAADLRAWSTAWDCASTCCWALSSAARWASWASESWA